MITGNDHMDGTEQLDDQLAAWATACNVSLVWTDGTLRLRESDGAVRAAVVFPVEFWSEFCRLTRSAQDAALVSMALSIELQYDPFWKGVEPQQIEISMSDLSNLGASFSS
jgi:hypothetical protein